MAFRSPFAADRVSLLQRPSRGALLTRGVAWIILGAAHVLAPALAGRAVAFVFGVLIGVWLVLEAVLRLVLVWRRRSQGYRSFGLSLPIALGTLVVGVLFLAFPVAIVSGFGVIALWGLSFLLLCTGSLLAGLHRRLRLTGVMVIVAAVTLMVMLLARPDIALQGAMMIFGLLLVALGAGFLIAASRRDPLSGVRVERMSAATPRSPRGDATSPTIASDQGTWEIDRDTL